MITINPRRVLLEAQGICVVTYWIDTYTKKRMLNVDVVRLYIGIHENYFNIWYILNITIKTVFFNTRSK